MGHTIIKGSRKEEVSRLQPTTDCKFFLFQKKLSETRKTEGSVDVEHCADPIEPNDCLQLRYYLLCSHTLLIPTHLTCKDIES